MNKQSLCVLGVLVSLSVLAVYVSRKDAAREPNVLEPPGELDTSHDLLSKELIDLQPAEQGGFREPTQAVKPSDAVVRPESRETVPGGGVVTEADYFEAQRNYRELRDAAMRQARKTQTPIPFTKEARKILIAAGAVYVTSWREAHDGVVAKSLFALEESDYPEVYEAKILSDKLKETSGFTARQMKKLHRVIARLEADLNSADGMVIPDVVD